MRLLPHLLLLALCLGCDSSGFDERERAELEAGDAQIELGETATVEGLAITFDAVVDDSRCPLDAVCVWEGQAVVTLTVEGVTADLLVSGPPSGTAAERSLLVRDRLVSAVGLAPYPRVQGQSGARPVVAVSVVPADD